MAAETTTTAQPQRMPILSEPLKEKIRSLFPRYPNKRAVTLPALHLVQEHLRCVPYQAMAEIAEVLEITPAEVHDTMSFYGFFPQAPMGDVRVWICRSLSCMLRGGDEMLEHACQQAGDQAGRDDEGGRADRRVRRVPGDLRLCAGRPGRRWPGLRAARSRIKLIK